MLSSGVNVIIWDKMLSSGVKCYHLELLLSSGTNWYHLGWKVIIWDAMLSSGANVIIWDKMLSCGTNVIMLSFGANVIIWCCHVMLSSGMITPPYFIFPENFTHSQMGGSLCLFLQRFIHMETHCHADNKLWFFKVIIILHRHKYCQF
jgi:hypothetical protein